MFRTLADEWVLYDPTSNQVHVLNLSAALVWTACDGERSLDAIVQEVTESYPDNPPADVVRADVTEAIERFMQEDLLTSATT